MGKIKVTIKIFETKADNFVNSLIRRGFNPNDFEIKKVTWNTIPSLKIMFRIDESKVSTVRICGDLNGAEIKFSKEND